MAGADIPQEEADAVAALLDFNSEETPAGAAAAAAGPEAAAGPSEPKAEDGGEDAEPEYLVKWVNRWVPRGCCARWGRAGKTLLGRAAQQP